MFILNINLFSNLSTRGLIPLFIVRISPPLLIARDVPNSSIFTRPAHSGDFDFCPISSEPRLLRIRPGGFNIEGVDQVAVLLFDDVAFDLEGWGQLAGVDFEVLFENDDLLDLLVGRQVDRRLVDLAHQEIDNVPVPDEPRPV